MQNKDSYQGHRVDIPNVIERENQTNHRGFKQGGVIVKIQMMGCISSCCPGMIYVWFCIF